MTIGDAIDRGIIIVNKNESPITYNSMIYNGLCKECRYSKCPSYPSLSNMCMNEESEWYGSFHVDHKKMRYINGCSVFTKI